MKLVCVFLLMSLNISFASAPDISGATIECEGDVKLVAHIKNIVDGVGSSIYYETDIFINGQKIIEPDGKSHVAITMFDEEESEVVVESIRLQNLWKMAVMFPEYQLNSVFFDKILWQSKVGSLPFAKREDFPQVRCRFKWPNANN